MQQLGILFDAEMPASRKVNTSEGAAIKIKDYASRLRDRCLKAFKTKNFTADELANFLGEPILNVRPRVSELKRLGLLEDLGVTRPSSSGSSMKVYRAKYEND